MRRVRRAGGRARMRCVMGTTRKGAHGGVRWRTRAMCVSPGHDLDENEMMDNEMNKCVCVVVVVV